MNRIDVSAEEVPLPPWGASLKKYIRTVLAELGRDKWDLSVLICGDKRISELNSRFRGKNEATDILSFSLSEGARFPVGAKQSVRFLGQIVISLDTLGDNARRFKVSEDEELRRLLIHGILHLDGMDHKTNKKTEPMLQLQERILSELEREHIVGRNT